MGRLRPTGSWNESLKRDREYGRHFSTMRPDAQGQAPRTWSRAINLRAFERVAGGSVSTGDSRANPNSSIIRAVTSIAPQLSTPLWNGAACGIARQIRGVIFQAAACMDGEELFGHVPAALVLKASSGHRRPVLRETARPHRWRPT
jgi:hypothetical protein